MMTVIQSLAGQQQKTAKHQNIISATTLDPMHHHKLSHYMLHWDRALLGIIVTQPMDAKNAQQVQHLLLASQKLGNVIYLARHNLAIKTDHLHYRLAI